MRPPGVGSRPDDPVRLMVGTYGTGKTHLLRYFRQLALSAGYAVSLVEMNPLETPFSQPKRVYSQIVRHLKWLDGGTEVGCRQLLERGLQAGLLDDHRYFRYLLDTRTDGLWQWIDGSDARSRPPLSAVGRTVPALYSPRPRLMSTAISSAASVGCAARELALKGLLVLFDESEALYATRGYQAMEQC